MTTIKLTGGDLGPDSMLVACELSQASAPIRVCYHPDDEPEAWSPTPYQCADAAHSHRGLERIAKTLGAAAVELPEDEFTCNMEDIS